MASKVDVKRKMFCGRELRAWSCCGPCMISFGIPLMIPGVTLTCVALSSNTGVEAFTGLHVTGFVFLAIGIFLICAGCVVYNVFRVKVGPLPIVLMSHADLRLTHSQRLYFHNRPTFEIRPNSAKSSTCFRIENEAKNHRSSDKVSKVTKLPEKFNRQNDDVSATNSKPSTSLTNPKDKSTRQRVESDSSEASSGETDSDDYTSSSYSSTDTSTSASETSLPRPPPPEPKTITNITVAAASDGVVATNNVETVHRPTQKAARGKFTQLESLTHDTGSHRANLARLEGSQNSGDYHYNDTGIRPNEDVKSEELKPSSVTTRAWYISDSETDTSPPINRTSRPGASGKRLSNLFVLSTSEDDADVSESYSEDNLSSSERRIRVNSSHTAPRQTLPARQLSSEKDQVQ